MSRRVITQQYQAKGNEPDIDGFFDRVLKYIPADIVAAWIAATGLIAGATGIPTATVLWIMFLVFLVITAFWTHKQTTVAGMDTATKQIIVSVASFAVWVFALGGPFTYLGFYNPVYGSLLLIVWSLTAAMIK